MVSPAFLVPCLLALIMAPSTEGQALCNVARNVAQFLPGGFAREITSLCRSWTSIAKATHSLSGFGIQSSVRGGIGENLLPLYSENPQGCGPTVRKEVRTLTDDEWQRFVNAVVQLKRTPQGQSNVYDEFALIHNATTTPQAHFTAMFLPWHREYLYRFENALKQIDCNIAIPYWDVTLDQPLPNGRDSILWTDYYYGSSVGPVTRGPFRNWAIPQQVVQYVYEAGIERGFDFNFGNILYRTLGEEGGWFFPPEVIQEVYRARNFRELTWGVDQLFEAAHAGPHLFTGGHHSIALSASFDPIFWIYHSFIDCLWEEWRQNYQRGNPETDYVTVDSELATEEELIPYARGDAPMLPFGPPLRNIDGLRNVYTQRYYSYARRPTCNSNYPDCGSPYLFCDTRINRCVSQIRQGGNCTGFEVFPRACYGAVCCGGVCSATCGTRVDNQNPGQRNDCGRTGCQYNSDYPNNNNDNYINYNNNDNNNEYNNNNNYPRNTQPGTFMDQIRRLEGLVTGLGGSIFK